ncbi:MAG: DPP IV N-terminal domain-containing protein, partial [Verrucomicrobiales bacterium]|nr:DPP IV N-terminal domain-containing protein [Verrucomicrobiales bacterium]
MKPPRRCRPLRFRLPALALSAILLTQGALARALAPATAVAAESPAVETARPRLQILNGSTQWVDLFWLESDTRRVPQGSVAPGAETILTTTLGHRFVLVGRNDQSETSVTSRVSVQAFRFGGVPSFYTQRLEAHGYPIVASSTVNPHALQEAAYLVDRLLAKRPDVREAMIQSGSRLCLLAWNEFTTDLPEFARLAESRMPEHPTLPAREYWDARARGLGGSETDPYCSCGEENLLGYKGDPYAAENILIHEFAHNIHLRGLVNVDPTFDARLRTAYDAARKAGLWRGKYAAVNHHEYFAEGVQSWFDNNRENDHDHNHVNTRQELIDYDPGLAALCREVFGDTDLKYTRPETRLTGHLARYDPAAAPKFEWPDRLQRARAEIRAGAQARNQAAQALATASTPETVTTNSPTNRTASSDREVRSLAGWTAYVSRDLLAREPEVTARTLELIETQLAEIVRVVPAPAVAELKQIPIYLSPPYPGVPPTAEYHPGVDWLRDHGRDPAMAKAVEITDVSGFEAEARRMPMLLLHELAHGYHDRVLPQGHGNPEIVAAYEKAKAAGKYERVERRDSEGRTRMDRHYALSNPAEYFAEGTEAFFGRNDFFPYTRDQLNSHDPELVTLLAKVWGVTNPEAGDPARLTVDRIFGKAQEFKTEDWGPARWLLDSSAYTTLEAAERPKAPGADPDADPAKDLVRYDPESGRRDVLVAAEQLIPPGESTPLTISDYAWSEDGNRVLLFTNTRRVWRQETRGDYWVFDLRTRALHKLGGNAPPSTLLFATFSPDGQRVAYVHQNNLYVQSLDTLRIKPLTTDGSDTVINGTADWVNEEEFDLRNGLRWSPDGRYLAYWQFETRGVREYQLLNTTDSLYPRVTSFAYPKAGETNSACRVGVVRSNGGKTRWFRPNPDPRNHYIPRMEWAKDSSSLVFQQLNRLQNTNQIISADPRTGATQVRFTDRDDAWVDFMDEMTWIEGGRRFLWLSERDGWRHLYAVATSGEQVTLLTPGEYDVVRVEGVDEQEGCVYFVASPEDPTQRHLYRASLDGTGAVVRVSSAEQRGTHDYEFSPDGRWAFHTYSRFGQPPVVDLVKLPEHRVVRTLAGNATLRDKVSALKPWTSEFFRVSVSNGPSLDAWCLKPPDFDPARKYPLLIHVYGEPAGSTVVDRWGGDTFLWHALLAQRGYVVVSIDNRGTAAPRGRDWRKSIYRQVGILASADQAAATREILRSRPYLDPSRVGIWGWSGGGSMSLNAIFRYPDLYQTAMAIAFVANQRFYDTIYQERYMGLPADNEDGFKNGSPLTLAHQLQGNLLLAYGTGDDNCHYQNCEVLVDELIRHH